MSKIPVPSILGRTARADGQTNLFSTTHVYYHTILSLGHLWYYILSHYTVISSNENVNLALRITDPKTYSVWTREEDKKRGKIKLLDKDCIKIEN